MKLRKPLLDLARVIADYAERDPMFADQIVEALGLKEKSPLRPLPTRCNTTRPKNRRPAAVLDPIQLVRDGEAQLRAALSGLTLEQLRDVVADYGMDPGKLVMKWKDADRIADRIVEISLARAQKGDAFRSDFQP
jgi:hypothetical protein